MDLLSYKSSHKLEIDYNIEFLIHVPEDALSNFIFKKSIDTQLKLTQTCIEHVGPTCHLANKE